jgi:hypothetical protein
MCHVLTCRATPIMYIGYYIYVIYKLRDRRKNRLLSTLRHGSSGPRAIIYVRQLYMGNHISYIQAAGPTNESPSLHFTPQLARGLGASI